MKYLEALAFSAMVFVGVVGRSLTQDFWQKPLYNKETPKKQKKADLIISLIVWAVFTIALFILVALFVN